MKTLFLSLMVLSMSAYAAESVKKVAATTTTSKTVESAKTLNVESGTAKKDAVAEDTALVGKPEMKVQVTCKSDEGHDLKKGDKGFDACIKKVKNDKNTSQTPNSDIKVEVHK